MPKLQDLIDAKDAVREESSKAVQEAELNIEKYIRSQTLTVQELYDIVKAHYDSSTSSSDQVSTWQILDIAREAISNKEKEM